MSLLVALPLYGNKGSCGRDRKECSRLSHERESASDAVHRKIVERADVTYVQEWCLIHYEICELMMK